MELKINDLSITEKEAEVTFTYDEIKLDIEDEIKKLSKNIQLAGFRKGKVPVAILKKMYGDALEFEASEKVASSRFYKIADDNKLNPIGHPHLTDIKYKPGEDFNFKVKYEVVPKLKVKDYTGNEVEIPDLQVKEKDVDSEIKHILKSNSLLEDVEMTGEDQNYVLDVEVTRMDEKGQPFPDAKQEKLKIDLTSEGIQPEIISNAKNKKTGEMFSFSFTDTHTHKPPHDIQPGEIEKAKEEIHTEVFNYNALIKGIKKIITPELNEELIKKVTKDKVTNEEDLRAEIKKDIQTYLDQNVESLLQNKLIDIIVNKNDFQPPKSMVASYLEELVKREEEEFKKQGYGKFDKNEAANRLEKLAGYEVKWYLIKEAIQEKENLVVTDDDLNQLAEQDAEKIGIPADKLLNYYKSSNYGKKLIDKKLFEFLKEKNKIQKTAPEKYSQNEEKETK